MDDNPFGGKPNPKPQNPYSSPTQSSGASGGDFQYEYKTPNRGGLILGLGIGSLSGLVIAFVCCSVLTVIPTGLGFIAWFMGRSDLRKIEEGTVSERNKELVQIGAYLGLLGGILSLLATLAQIGLVIFFVVMAAQEGEFNANF